MNKLREAVENEKQYYIKKLLEMGVYKTDQHLYELTLSELKTQYLKTIKPATVAQDAK